MAREQWGEEQWVWDGQVHTAVSKNGRAPRTYCVACTAQCDSLNGNRIWTRIDTCVHGAESLCCLPETNTALLIGYTPMWNKKPFFFFFKKKRVLQGSPEYPLPGIINYLHFIFLSFSLYMHTLVFFWIIWKLVMSLNASKCIVLPLNTLSWISLKR